MRGGLKTVLIPQENEKDLAEIPDKVTKGMTIIPVSNVDDVLEHALTAPLQPIEWDEEAELEAALAKSRGEDDDMGGVVTH